MRLTRFALFNYGFRPFFLLAGLYATIAIAIWLAALSRGAGMLPPGVPPSLWHGHEMLFGFVAAAMGGFLLTAVPGWTGTRALSGVPLAAVVLAWLAGRVALCLYGIMPAVWAAALDLAYFPALVLAVTPPLLRARPHNRVFPLFLAILFAANLVFHVGIARADAALAAHGLMIGVHMVLLLVVIIGGRIVPAFTQGALRQRDPGAAIAPLPALDRAAILATVLVLVAELVGADARVGGAVALLAAVCNALRFSRWKTRQVLGIPIVWVLHAGYAWVIAGLALKGIFLLAHPPFASMWLHALTAGAFATMILAVMTRAALGHTGRPLAAPRPIVACYVLITLAAILRVASPVLPVPYLHAIMLSGGFWLAAFLLFLFVYTPILLMPRADGKPG
jgi:uncharacterized protein involved in response to NO